MKKLKYLDGIRGLMAINVLICHFICVYYPQMYQQSWIGDNGGFLTAFAVTPLSAFVNGNIAVQYFFVLTGFLAGRSVLLKDKFDTLDIVRKSCNRYIRLLPVCAIATLFAALLMVCGFMKHLDIVSIAANGEFAENYCNFEPTFLNVILNVFVKPFISGSDYINPFWTIKYELFGYILIIITATIFKKLKLRRILYLIVAAAVIILLDSNYLGFFAGLIAADLICLNQEKSTYISAIYERWLYKTPSLIVIALIGLYCATCPMQFSFIHKPIGMLPFINTAMVRAIGCSMLVFCLARSKFVYKIFEFKPLLFIGELSFPIYALYWPLMLSLEAWLFRLFADKLPYDAAAILGFLITVAVIIPMSLIVLMIEKKLNLNVDGLFDKISPKRRKKG